ncbi:TolC family protein [Hyphomonas johnsonii]|uniref:TolC family protein n=1 Tax=Hyphomonas johnsonii TaxID=81031 RepID=UPI000550A232|nr:TolC family protein [Hyphomonas johnsonii]
MFRPRLLLACAGISSALIAAADAQSFPDLESALHDHPSLQAMAWQAEANRERANAATALPDPVISAGINNFPIFDPSFSDFLPTSKSVGIQQKFPSLAGRNARAGEALARASEIREMRAQRYAALRGDLIALLHEKQRTRIQRDLAEERTEKYDALTRVAERELDAGRPALFRLAEIEGERAELDRTLVELNGQAEQIDARLVELLGTVPDTPPPPVMPIDWSGDAMAFHAVRVADAGIAVRDRGIDDAKAGWKPEWGVQLTYQQRESGANYTGDDWVSGMVSVTVPFWASKNQAPRLRAAKAERAAARANFSAAARTAAAQYSTYRSMRLTAEQSAAVLSRKIVAIEDEITSRTTIYESGVGDYAPIIDGELAILKLRSEMAGEQARIATATARMNALLVTQ